MGRHAKVASPQDPQLKAAIEGLNLSGGDKYSWRARAETPGRMGKPFIGEAVPLSELPSDELGAFAKRLREENPHVGEIMIGLYGGGNEVLKDAQGNKIQVVFPSPSGANGATLGRPASYTDPDIERERAEVEKEKQRVAIEEDRMRLENRKKAIATGKPPGEADDSRWPFGPGVPYKVVEVEPGVFAPIRMQDEDDSEGRFSRRRSERKDPMELFLAMMSQQQAAAQAAADRNMQLLTALLTREDPSTKLLLGILPVLTGDKMKLPELMAMFQSMNKGQEAAIKATMEFQSSMMEKTVDRLLDSDKPSGPVETAKEIMGLVKEGAETGVKAIFGRPSIINPDAAKAPPLPPKKQLPQKATVTPLPNPPQAQLPPQEAPKELSPAEQAALVAKHRCAEVLAIHEREMLVGSAPGLLLSTKEDADKLIAAIDALPREIQAALDDGEVAKIYDAFKLYQPETVDRIFAVMNDPKTGEAAKKWAADFWDEIITATRGEEEDEPEPEAPAV